MWPRIDGRRVLALGTPGKIRTWLTDLTLSGAKTATAGLLPLDYETEGEEVEHVGEHLILVNDAGEKAATIEITSVELVPFAEVPWEFAEAEGEGYTSIEDWRETHRRYWSSQGYEVTDASPIVCLHYRLLPP
ncbi:ASCH domain-containing protein [Nonomuraea sp. WAC 01424]|uniref:ASCH domain-containing protein n=2 Tax=Nonomuraea TaxID=83681 RepID=UPI000F769C63|nr:ASCH domain-containing protein [Nonomuraea sp. WAC 01424]RSM96498.1 ASCH domain-containing protein [Nonomuraea sp. WAC 01424]